MLLPHRPFHTKVTAFDLSKSIVYLVMPHNALDWMCLKIVLNGTRVSYALLMDIFRFNGEGIKARYRRLNTALYLWPKCLTRPCTIRPINKTGKVHCCKDMLI